MKRVDGLKFKVMVKVLTLMVVLGLSSWSKAEDPVYFASANLKDKVEEALGVINPTPTDMLNLTYLNAERWDVLDITGLEYATNLKLLNLSSDFISDISALSGLTDMQYLYLSGNQISDISPLSGMTGLIHLNISANPVDDFSVLSGLTNLTSLDLSYTNIRDIALLSGLTNLTSLNLSANLIRDISALSGMTSLRSLNLLSNTLNNDSYCTYLPLFQDNNPGIILSYDPGNGCLALSPNGENPVGFADTNLKIIIEDILGISDPTPSHMLALTVFAARLSEITDLSGLEYATNLTTLDLSGNQISDISPLSSMTQLEYLYLQENQINDVSALSSMNELIYLWLNNNLVMDISVLSALTNLESLRLHSNRLDDISALSGMVKLRWLYLANNQISDISALSAMSNLFILDLDENSLNSETYCTYLPLLAENNPDLYLGFGLDGVCILGTIDSINPEIGELKGWACVKGRSTSISIDIYLAGYTDGDGVLLDSVVADELSEEGVANACNSYGTQYRFSYLLPVNDQQYCGRSIYVYGDSSTGYTSALANSGIFYISDCQLGEDQRLTPSNTQMDLGFSIGATSDGGIEYRHQFSSDEVVDVNASISIDPVSIGQEGLLYAVVLKNGSLYMLTADQGLVSWDLNMGSLLPFTALQILRSEETFKVFDNLNNEPGRYYVYVGYQVEGEELYYNVESLFFTVD